MKGTQLRTLTIETPFAVFSDVHGNLPGLEAILADIELRGVPQTISLGDLVGYGPSPNEVALSCASAASPQSHGQLRPGHRLRDRRLRLRLQDRRAARRGAASLAWTQRGRDRRGQGVPAHAGGPLHAGDRRPATCSPCTAARGASTSTSSRIARPSHGAHGSRSIPHPGHPLRPHARALRPAASATRPSSTSAAAGAPRTATGASATRWSTRRGLVRPASSSSCACPTTTSGCNTTSLRRR